MPSGGPVDAHYTPPWLAKRLAQLIDGSHARVVADLAAGDGELLRAAQAILPTGSRFVARDCDGDAVAAMRSRHPDWDVAALDVFAVGDNLAKSVGEVDLMLLNPPFSYRGGGGVVVETGEIAGRFSPAVAFMLYSMSALAPSGHCLALLPANSVVSEKDGPAVRFLRDTHGLKTIELLPRGTFPGVHARVVLVSTGWLGPSPDSEPSRPKRVAAIRRALPIEVEVIRGTTPVHRTRPGSEADTEFLHSVGVRKGAVITKRVIPPLSGGRRVSGPFIAISRVGQPSASKIAVCRNDGPVLLSDCVIAIRPVDSKAVDRVLGLLSAESEGLSALYQGSCAPYLTVSRLNSFLCSLGLTLKS